MPGCSPDKIQRLYLAQYDGGFLRCYHKDLPAYILEQLERLSPDQVFNNTETVKAILKKDALCDEIWRGKSYLFPQTLTLQDFPDVMQLDATHQAQFEQFAPGESISSGPMYAVIVDGRIISACQSSQENDMAAEAWVRTLPEFRRRGYARQVTAAWAYHLQQQGKQPFYSHRLDNSESEAVARSLQLVPYVTEVSYF